MTRGGIQGRGGAIEGRFGERPFPALLVDLLRWGESGRLELVLAPHPRNTIEFRAGVPVRVHLPDLEGSASDGDRLPDLDGAASDGDRLEARCRRAEDKLVRLFDIGDLGYRFVPGQPSPDPAGSTLLRPLALLFTGFRASLEARAAEPWLPSPEARLRVGLRYPRGVDPFDFGAELDAALEPEVSVARLLERGFDRCTARAALAALHLTEMLEPIAGRHAAPERHEGGAARDAGGRAARERDDGPLDARERGDGPLDAPERNAGGGAARERDTGGRDPRKPLEVPRAAHRSIEGPRAVVGPLELDERPDELGGLVVLPRPGRLLRGTEPGRAPQPPAASPPAPSLVPDPPDPAEVIAARLGPLERQGYYRLLRVGPDTDPAQLERAYRYLHRRLEEEASPDPGTVALLGVLGEAWALLRDPGRAARYAAASEPERRGFEADPKADRALRVLGEGRSEEALYLIAWAVRLAPGRAELEALAVAVSWLARPVESRGPSPRGRVRAVARRIRHPRLEVALAALLAAEGELARARGIALAAGVDDHPLVVRFLGKGEA